MITAPKKILRHLFGSGTAREDYNGAKKSLRQYESSIHALKETLPTSFEFNQTEPIFIISAGWRSGSTLLQRLVCSSKDTILWGEPYDHCGIIQKLASSLQAFSSSWPPDSYYYHEQDIANTWVANLYPKTENLILAYYAFIEKLFVPNAVENKNIIWGLKEVRFGMKEVLFLKFLFPNAKFLYLKRNLFDAYESYTKFNIPMNWYRRWPDEPTFTPFRFAFHRAKLLKEFELSIEKSGGLLIEYEQLISKEFNFDELNQYCNVKVDNSILQKKIGSSSNAKGKISNLEYVLLKTGDFYGQKNNIFVN